MRVLITGSEGQVGHCLVQQFNIRKDIELLALNRRDLDITQSTQVHDIVTRFQPDIIINAAAYTAVDKAEQEKELAFAINHQGTKNLAEAAKFTNAVLLHISTDYVFAGDKIGVYTEDDQTAPQSTYGESKLAGEKAISAICPRHIILRTAWVFGEHGNNFVKTMLKLGQSRRELSVVADQFGGPTYADDIAKALVGIAEKVKSVDFTQFGIYHFSGGPHVSWYEFAQAIFSQALKQNILDEKVSVKAITTSEYPTAAKRPANSKLSSEKLLANFGIQPSNWKAALNELKGYK